MANSEYQQRKKISLLMFPIIKDDSILIGESDCSFLTFSDDIIGDDLTGGCRSFSLLYYFLG